MRICETCKSGVFAFYLRCMFIFRKSMMWFFDAKLNRFHRVNSRLSVPNWVDSLTSWKTLDLKISDEFIYYIYIFHREYVNWQANFKYTHSKKWREEREKKQQSDAIAKCDIEWFLVEFSWFVRVHYTEVIHSLCIGSRIWKSKIQTSRVDTLSNVNIKWA